MNRRISITILTLVLSLAVIAGWYFDLSTIYFIIPILLIYTIINVLGSINIQWNYFIDSINAGETSEKKIAITFDDGPDTEITPVLLNVLSRYKVPATFFCIGNKINGNKEIVHKIVEHGHIIGNHSFFHSNYFDLLSSARMRKEIDMTNNDIYKITGLKPTLFRPPFGVTNPSLYRALKKTNMVAIGWSLRSLDTIKTKEQVLEKLKSNTKAGDIVLFHDTTKYIPQLIEEYISWVASNGYKIVSLDNLINISAYEN